MGVLGVDLGVESGGAEVALDGEGVVAHRVAVGERGHQLMDAAWGRHPRIIAQSAGSYGIEAAATTVVAGTAWPEGSTVASGRPSSPMGTTSARAPSMRTRRKCTADAHFTV